MPGLPPSERGGWDVVTVTPSSSVEHLDLAEVGLPSTPFIDGHHDQFTTRPPPTACPPPPTTTDHPCAWSFSRPSPLPRQVSWILSCWESVQAYTGGAPTVLSIAKQHIIGEPDGRLKAIGVFGPYGSVPAGARCRLTMEDNYGDGWNGIRWSGFGHGPYSMKDHGVETLSEEVWFDAIIYPPPSPPPVPSMPPLAPKVGRQFYISFPALDVTLHFDEMTLGRTHLSPPPLPPLPPQPPPLPPSSPGSGVKGPGQGAGPGPGQGPGSGSGSGSGSGPGNNKGRRALNGVSELQQPTAFQLLTDALFDLANCSVAPHCRIDLLYGGAEDDKQVWVPLFTSGCLYSPLGCCQRLPAAVI